MHTLFTDLKAIMFSSSCTHHHIKNEKKSKWISEAWTNCRGQKKAAWFSRAHYNQLSMEHATTPLLWARSSKQTVRRREGDAYFSKDWAIGKKLAFITKGAAFGFMYKNSACLFMKSLGFSMFTQGRMKIVVLTTFYLTNKQAFYQRECNCTAGNNPHIWQVRKEQALQVRLSYVKNYYSPLIFFRAICMNRGL